MDETKDYEQGLCIYFQKLRRDAIIPTRNTSKSAGLDLYRYILSRLRRRASRKPCPQENKHENSSVVCLDLSYFLIIFA